jgi:hypothetical protein
MIATPVGFPRRFIGAWSVTFALLALTGCVYHDLNEIKAFDCSTSTLTLSLASQQEVSSCTAADGMITVASTGGTAPLFFSLNNGLGQASSQFSNLRSGSYSVTVKDNNQCSISIQVDLAAANSNLVAQATTNVDNQCNSNNGSITITASGGVAPYLFALGSAGFGAGNVFTGLASGPYTVHVKDSLGCSRLLAGTVLRGNTGVSYANDISAILQAHCNNPSCHGGSSGEPNFTTYDMVRNNAADIKLRTGNRSMPPDGTSLTQDQINLIACWVDDGANNN